MLFSVAHICDSLTAQPISLCAEMYSHLSKLDLADVSNGETHAVRNRCADWLRLLLGA